MKYILLFILFFSTLSATKISDVSSIVGVRENQLIGYSLVVGLKKNRRWNDFKIHITIYIKYVKSDEYRYETN